jgi:uncharacterized SAM-binding protein YcdF (DUF218 family)
VDLFAAKKILAALVLPPTGPLLVAAAGLLLATRRRRSGLALVGLGLLALFAMSLPGVAHLLLRAVDRTPPLDFAVALDAQAIVILGGGTRRAAPEYGGDTLGRLTLERVRYGAVVARRTALPVLVSGGAVSGGIAEGVLMKRALEEEFAVPVRWVEARSRDTQGNAEQSAALLGADGVTRVILVAHGFDMPRASAEFAHAGLSVIPAPTVIAAERFPLDHASGWMPSVSALQGSYYALYEWLADAARRVRRAI